MGLCAAAQSCGRRDVGRDSLAPTQQQVEEQHDGYGCSCAVEQEIQYRQWRYLFRHIVLMIAFKPQNYYFLAKPGKFSEKVFYYLPFYRRLPIEIAGTGD